VNVQEHQFLIGQDAQEATRVIVAILRDLYSIAGEGGQGRAPVYPILGVVKNLGSVAFTLYAEGSADNSAEDSYAPLQLRVAGAGATSIVVSPGALIKFLVEGVTLTQSTGSVDLTGNPADEDMVTISDGTTEVTFEFDDDATVTAGNVAVTIGLNAAATIATFISVFNATALNITAAAGGGDSADLTSDDTHPTNVTITEDEAGANITVVGMTGGVFGRAPYYRFRTSVVTAEGELSLAHYAGMLESRNTVG